MCGITEQEKVLVDMMADEAMDFRNGWVRLCYNPKFVRRFLNFWKHYEKYSNLITSILPISQTWLFIGCLKS